MVLSFVKNDFSKNSGGIFIHTSNLNDESEFTLTLLLQEKAFSNKVSGSCSFVSTWAQRLNLSPREYLEQLLSALQEQQKLGSVNENNSLEDGNSSKDIANTQHVFQVETSVLTWKQYFPDKQIYGRRGAVPLQETEYTAAVWQLLQEAVQKQSEAHHQILKLENANSALKIEVDKALALSEDSLRATDNFKQQNYAKFCELLNSKKEKIRELEEALYVAPGSSRSANTSAAAAAPRPTSTCPATKKRPNKSVISRGDPTIKPNSDDDYDDDTDVDDATHYDTDDENEKFTSERSTTHANTRGTPSSNNKGGLRIQPSNKREAPEGVYQSSKKASHCDSQDDLFNSTIEDTSLALLSNIKPRETATVKGKSHRKGR